MSPNPLTDLLPACGLRDDAWPLDGANVREMAQRLRTLARDCRLPGARRELLDLAAKFDRRADYFDSRHAFDSRRAAFEPASKPRCLAPVEPAY